MKRFLIIFVILSICAGKSGINAQSKSVTHRVCNKPSYEEFVTGRTQQIIDEQAELIKLYDERIRINDAFIKAWECTYGS